MGVLVLTKYFVIELWCLQVLCKGLMKSVNLADKSFTCCYTILACPQCTFQADTNTIMTKVVNAMIRFFLLVRCLRFLHHF